MKVHTPSTHSTKGGSRHPGVDQTPCGMHGSLHAPASDGSASSIREQPSSRLTATPHVTAAVRSGYVPHAKPSERTPQSAAVVHVATARRLSSKTGWYSRRTRS